MKKKEKIVKVLSDGTVAKVGMIVRSLNGPITRIKATVNENAENIIGYVWNLKERPDLVLCEGWFCPTHMLTKATPEERKQYYAELYAKNK